MLTYFSCPIKLINCLRIENTSYLVFSPCHYGLSYPDMDLTQISWHWLATASPGAGLTLIPLCSLVNWNTWLFIIKYELISIPGHLIFTMHLSCQNPNLLLNFHSICGDICMITPQLWSLWLIIDICVKKNRSTLSTIKILYIYII